MTATGTIPVILNEQRRFFASGATKPYAARREALERLAQALVTCEQDLQAALAEDLGKSEFEGYLTEIGYCRHELRYTIRKLKRWMKPRRVRTPLLAQAGSSVVHYVPLGVNLIVCPFNYPVHLTLAPLTAAIAAGNTAVVKTSEQTPACSEVLRRLIEETFDRRHVACVTGGVAETTALLNERFDHIFFTGSPRVGAIVMKAAAEHLTPVTLELGGKSPCIVHHDAKLRIAARRIAYGKFLNVGQTCVAPDYVLVHRQIKEQLIEFLKERVVAMYGPDASASPDYGRIVSEAHCRRIVSLIDESKVVLGGQHDVAKRFIAPTIMADVTLDDRVMGEEVFGPVLPILEYDDLDEVCRTVDRLPQHPLACYVFSESRAVRRQLMERIQFGGGCTNHCLQHLANPNLPFGGVGLSGMGSYHGFAGFERFSHRKSILQSSTRFDMSLPYPPYKGKLAKIRALMR